MPPLDLASDDLLMTRTQAGDEAAFAVLVRRHTARLARVVQPLVHGAAADVVQATFLSAWTGRHQFDPRHGSLVSWLCAIARNRACDALRAERRHERLDCVALEAGVVDPVCGREGPADRAQRSADAAAVRRALAALGEEQRTVLGLAYFGGLSQSEIQRRTGVALGTVKGRSRLGLLALHRALAEPAHAPAIAS